MHGIWTRPPNGSQVRPRLCLAVNHGPLAALTTHSMPISAACKMTSGSAPKHAEMPAAYLSARLL